MNIKEVTIHSGSAPVTTVAVGKDLFTSDGKKCDYKATKVVKKLFRNVIEIQFSNGKKIEYHGYNFTIS